MFALVVLVLVACESASSFKFNKKTDIHDKVIYYPNISPSNHFDDKFVILNEQRKNITMKKASLDLNIEDIEMQKKKLYKEMKEIYREKEYFDREIEKLNRKIDDIYRKTDIIYTQINNFDTDIDCLNTQKDLLDNEIDKVDLKIEEHNMDTDRNRYEIHRAAVENNEYRITINMPGYNENEIVVKSGKGRLVVQALHDVLGEPKMSFQNSRNLPNFVSENGSWSYKYGVLRIVFPVTQRTRHETKRIVYKNSVIGRSDLDKKNSVSSTETAQVPTTYVSTQDEDVNAATQVGGNDIVANTNSKSEKGEVEPTTFSSPGDKIETTAYGSTKDDGLEVSTSIPTYVTNQEDDIVHPRKF